MLRNPMRFLILITLNGLSDPQHKTYKVSFSDADSDDLESLGAFAVATFKPQPGKKRKNESGKDGQKNPKQGKYKRNGYIYLNTYRSVIAK